MSKEGSQLYCLCGAGAVRVAYLLTRFFFVLGALRFGLDRHARVFAIVT